MADLKMAKFTYDRILKMCDLLDDLSNQSWRVQYPQYHNWALRDIILHDVYNYILYLGTTCNSITQKASDFVKEYLELYSTPSDFKRDMKRLESNFTFSITVPDGFKIVVAADNEVKAETPLSKFLFESYHDLAIIFLAYAGKTEESLISTLRYERVITIYIMENLNNNDWIYNRD